MKLKKYIIWLVCVIPAVWAAVFFVMKNKEEQAVPVEQKTVSAKSEEDVTSMTEQEAKSVTFEDVRMMKAGEMINVSEVTQELSDKLFFKEDIGEEVKARIMGISYKENEFIGLDELQYIRTLYIGFDGNTYVGELIVNKAIADDIIEIMRCLYENKYPIEKMVLIDEYGGDDVASMTDNNSSAFNYRVIANTTTLSNHAKGMAIDINPLYNPYVTYDKKGRENVSPQAGEEYADRTKEFSYKIDENDLCYQLFISHGFSWGGSWSKSKDYQHFEKTIN